MDATGIRQMLSEVESDIARLQSVADYLREKIAAANGRVVPRGKSSAATSAGSSSSTSLAGFKQVDAAEIVLKEAGKPMPTADIARAMIDRGFEGGDFAKLRKNLYVALWRSSGGRFKSAGAGIWRLGSQEQAAE